MKIIAIECNDGRFFITDNLENKSYFSSMLNKLFFDGKNPEPSFCKDWYIISAKPQRVQKEVFQPDINFRYELIDKTMKSEKIPNCFSRNEVLYINSKSGCSQWKNEYTHLKSLYELKSDNQPSKMEDVDFEFVVVMKVANIPSPGGFSYDVQKTQWEEDGLVQITEKDVTYQLLDMLIFPKPLLPQRPCKFTSEQTYTIVRQYIKQHINLEIAEITSDYDFCFTVKKKIPLSEIEKYTVDVNIFSKRKPNYEQRFRKYREVPIFEMTYFPRNYRGYTPIEGFQGESHEDLQHKINIYCQSLIDFINTPVKDCETCKGLGVIVEKELTL